MKRRKAPTTIDQKGFSFYETVIGERGQRPSFRAPKTATLNRKGLRGANTWMTIVGQRTEFSAAFWKDDQ